MNEKVDRKTKHAIVEASMKLFAERGYHGVSVAQIAKATSLTKGALYWHFSGKAELFLTVLDRIRDNWQQTVMSRVEASDGAIEKIEQLFEATGEMVANADKPHSMHLFLISAGSQPEMREFEDAIRAAYSGYFRTLADTLKEGQEAGDIRRDVDTESAAVGIIGCIEGIVLQARLYPPPTIAAAIAEMKHHFIDSLRVTSKRQTKKEKKRAPSGSDQLEMF